jgi:hypothetical protein
MWAVHLQVQQQQQQQQQQFIEPATWQKSLKVIGCAVRMTLPPGVWATGPADVGSAPTHV